MSHDKVVQGDEVHGDKVLGDKITITEEAAYNVYGPTNPYLGLRAFRYEDRAIYAGREQLAQETVQRVTAPGAQQTLLFITGASGSGKSSFVQAALIPLLESHYAAYQKRVRHAIFRPSSQPLVMLADALQRLHPDRQTEFLPETRFVTHLTQTPSNQINLLLIDQFEELFIQSEASQRAPFCDFLTNLPNFADCHTHILITLRVDYLDELFAIQSLWAIAKEGVELRTMPADDLRNAIQKPLQVHHPQKRFALELLDRLVQDAGEDAALLPLLQVTLAELWKTGKLVLSNYHSLTNAIRQRAEAVYAFSDHASADPKVQRLADDQQELMGILLDLINVSIDGADRRDARQRRTRQELERGAAHRPRLIEELVNARLLSAARETRNGADVEVIDIIHESLIDNWDRLRQVIEDQRQQLQRRARFKLWLGEWLRNERMDGYLLLTDMQLAEARVLVEARDIEVQGEEAREFYQRSLEWQKAERQKELQRVKELAETQQREAEAQRRRAQTFRWAVMVAAILSILALGFAEWGWRNSITASKNEATAVAARATSDKNAAEARVAQSNAEQQAAIAHSRQLAAQSTSELSNSRYEPAILLAIESGKIMDTTEAFSSIRTAIANPWHSRVVLIGHTEHVAQATWSKDGRKILTASQDDTARIWDASSGQELVDLTGCTFTQATWSQDERKILTTSGDGTVCIWDPASGQKLVTLAGHSGLVEQAMWSQDGRKVLTASGDNTARIWDATSGIELVKLAGHSAPITQATWSQDGRKILTASWDNTARIWDVTTGKELVKLEGYTGSTRMMWSRDGSKILTGSWDNTARIWDTATGKELVKLDGGYLATWSHDERKILTSSADGNVRVWDMVSGLESIRLTGHILPVSQAMWSQDERKILTASRDGTARIWDAIVGKELIRLVGYTGPIYQAAWNQDESKILTISTDDTARIWDLTKGNELVTLTGDAESVTHAILSQDESKILTVGCDNFTTGNLTGLCTTSTVHIWDTVSGQELVKLVGHHVWVTQAMWSHNGSKILTASWDETARIWDVATGKELIKLEGHTGPVEQAMWNQDETRILTAGSDGTARIWEAATGRELVKLVAHPEGEGPTQATWSQDERKILTAGGEGTARIWDATTGKELVKLAGDPEGGRVSQAAWSKDGSKILTASRDNTVRIWEATTGKELAKFEGHTDRVNQVTWSQDETRILTASSDGTVRIWDADSGKELVTFGGRTRHVTQAMWSRDERKVLSAGCDNYAGRICTQGNASLWNAVTGKELVIFAEGTMATWSKDESKILTINNDKTVSIWYTHMADLLVAACAWVPRNFSWAEWGIYLEAAQGFYRPTCPNTPIPSDVITAIQNKAQEDIRAGQIVSATQRLHQLNGWLQVNGQFKNFGVDVPAFVKEVAATATAGAMPSLTVMPELGATSTRLPTATQSVSPLRTHTSPMQ